MQGHLVLLLVHRPYRRFGKVSLPRLNLKIIVLPALYAFDAAVSHSAACSPIIQRQVLVYARLLIKQSLSQQIFHFPIHIALTGYARVRVLANPSKVYLSRGKGTLNYTRSRLVFFLWSNRDFKRCFGGESKLYILQGYAHIVSPNMRSGMVGNLKI